MHAFYIKIQDHCRYFVIFISHI